MANQSRTTAISPESTDHTRPLSARSSSPSASVTRAVTAGVDSPTLVEISFASVSVAPSPVSSRIARGSRTLNVT